MTQPKMTAAFANGLIFAFILSMANGANDCCNSVGTSVGAGALRVGEAVALGSAFEFLGAATMGQYVSKEISQGILDADDYVGGDQGLYALCLLAVLVAGAVTTLGATFYGLPISATHGIIGGLVAVGLAAKGSHTIGWRHLEMMLAGWALSPALAMVVASVVYVMVHVVVLRAPDPEVAGRRFQPWFLWLTVTTCVLFIIECGPEPVKKVWKWAGEWFAVALSVVLGMILTALYKSFEDGWCSCCACLCGSSSNSKDLVSNSKTNFFTSINANTHKQTAAEAEAKAAPLDAPVILFHDSEAGLQRCGSEDGKGEGDLELRSGSALERVERLFNPLLVLSALCVAFAHGANDVGNAVGALSVIYEIYHRGSIPAGGTPGIPAWALLMGACGFVMGIIMLGSKTIATVGTGITKLSPTCSFATQLGTAVSVLASSVIGLPVSTSHCLVGAVVGVSLTRKYALRDDAELSLRMLTKIVVGWVVTIPLAMLVAICVFLPLHGTFK